MNMIQSGLRRMCGSWLFLPLAVLGLVLFSACASLPSFVGGPYSLLWNAVSALPQVKSAQTTITLTENTQVGNATPTTAKIDASGVVAWPQHQFQVQLTPTGAGTPMTVQVTGTQGKEFLQVPGAPAISFSLPSVSSLVPDLLSHLDLPTLLGVAQQLQITDHGVQSLNGMQLHHLTVTLDAATVKQVLAMASKNQQILQPLANALQQANGTLDLYIDDQTSLVHQVQIQGTAQYLTPSGVQATTQVNAVILVSNYNQAVHITAPTNVISVTAVLPSQGK